MTAPESTRAPARPALTALVSCFTLAVSVAALFSPALMRLFTRDLVQLREGQWWRAVTPLLVQSSGWRQLVFNLVGLAVVGAALEARSGRTSWAVTYLVGGAGSIALLSAWKPTATGGGSSDAIAALIGALAVLVVADDRPGRWAWAAQVYSIFFVTYLTALDLGGVWPAMIIGDVAVALLFAARRAISPASLNRACLIVLVTGGATMAVARDGHGTGILAGTAIASLVLTRRRLLGRAGTAQPAWRLLAAVLAVPAVTVLTWAAWVRLLGVDRAPGGGRRGFEPGARCLGFVERFA